MCFSYLICVHHPPERSLLLWPSQCVKYNSPIVCEVKRRGLLVNASEVLRD